MKFGISITPEIRAAIDKGAVVAIGVSGGKDSSAVALRVADYLDEIGHTGPRVLIHSDLGRVEWKESLPVCERLAARMGWELLTVRRAAGDLMDRWLGRWANNVERYVNLSCVKLILPWSTPSMRFCTSELKTDVICSALKKRFTGMPIVSVTGIRRAESASRARMPVSQVQPKLKRPAAGGWNWNAIIDWPTEDVFAYLEMRGEPLHEAYTVYGCSRVSCAFCIMSAQADLAAAISCPDNHDLYREMVDLEIRSTFAFQGSAWLGDLAPHLLPAEPMARLKQAKIAAKVRTEAESRLPEHLLYVKGWPVAVPTKEEAEMIGSVRRTVGEALGLTVLYTAPEEIRGRYAELIDLRESKTKIAA